MAIINIKINGEIVDKVKFSELDLDNYFIIEKVSPSKLASFYEFKCGNYYHKWEQGSAGGKIELEEESSELYFSTGKALKVIKEIELKDIYVGIVPVVKDDHGYIGTPTPPVPPKGDDKENKEPKK